MMMLAQLLPEMTKGMPVFLVSSGAALWIANELFKLAKNIKGRTPEPPNEQLDVTQRELSRRVQALEDAVVEKEWFGKIERDIETMRVEANTHRENKDRIDSTHRASIYKAIDAVRAETGKHIEDVRRELSADIKDMPNQLITLLKNTNAI